MQQESIDWQAVFFDFDGVIADSGQVKTNAFFLLFAAYGSKVQNEVVAYHLANGGVPRRDKLRYCLEKIAGQNCTEEELILLQQRFAELVLEEVVAAPLVAGALDTLRQLMEAKIPAYIVSGTPHEEMCLVAERKGLRPFFWEIHGSPKSKAVIIRDILKRYKHNPAECLFIGDALADYRAAQETGLAFLGIIRPETASMFARGVPVSFEVRLNRWRDRSASV